MYKCYILNNSWKKIYKAVCQKFVQTKEEKFISVYLTLCVLVYESVNFCVLGSRTEIRNWENFQSLCSHFRFRAEYAANGRMVRKCISKWFFGFGYYVLHCFFDKLQFHKFYVIFRDFWHCYRFSACPRSKHFSTTYWQAHIWTPILKYLKCILSFTIGRGGLLTFYSISFFFLLNFFFFYR